MSNMHLYPVVERHGKDFSNEKIVTLPNQNMSLKDIIRRFLRKESLPIEKDGIYVDGLGDLEKLQHEDITVRKEKAAWIRSRLKAAEAADKASAGKGVPVESPSVNPPGPLGPVTGGVIVGQAPPAAPL